MRSHQLSIGRSFGVTLDDGEDFLASLTEFCRSHDLRQGYIPMFIAGFARVEIAGTCSRVDDPRAPTRSAVHLANVEVLGSGTIAYDETEQTILPHIHVTAGLTQYSAAGHTSHLFSATVQLLTEMVVVEVTSPQLRRQQNPDLYGIPLLVFGPDTRAEHAPPAG